MPLKSCSPQRRLVAALQGRARIGEVEPAVRRVGCVVRAVQPAALVAVHQGRPRAVRLHARDEPVAVLAHHEAAFGVQRQPVGADRPQTGAVALEHRLDEGARPVGLGPLVDAVPAHVGKEQPRPGTVPDRAFGEDVAVGELLDARVARHELVEAGIDTQDGAGAGVRRGCLGRRFGGRFRCTASHGETRDDGKAKGCLQSGHRLHSSIPSPAGIRIRTTTPSGSDRTAVGYVQTDRRVCRSPGMADRVEESTTA